MRALLLCALVARVGARAMSSFMKNQPDAPVGATEVVDNAHPATVHRVTPLIGMGPLDPEEPLMEGRVTTMWVISIFFLFAAAGLFYFCAQIHISLSPALQALARRRPRTTNTAVECDEEQAGAPLNERSAP